MNLAMTMYYQVPPFEIQASVQFILFLIIQKVQNIDYKYTYKNINIPSINSTKESLDSKASDKGPLCKHLLIFFFTSLQASQIPKDE